MVSKPSNFKAGATEGKEGWPGLICSMRIRQLCQEKEQQIVFNKVMYKALPVQLVAQILYVIAVQVDTS